MNNKIYNLCKIFMNDKIYSLCKIYKGVFYLAFPKEKDIHPEYTIIYDG